MIRLVLAMYTITMAMYVPLSANAQDVNARYPYRLPQWLWDTPSSVHLISAEEVIMFRSDIAKLQELTKVSTNATADKLEVDIAQKLAKKFALRDLATGGYIIKSSKSNLALILQIDPSFSSTAKATLQRAVSQFLDVGLDAAVINEAFERSSDTLSPMPQQWVTKDGKEQNDELGRPQPTADFAFYLRQRVRPLSPAQFESHLRSVLSPTIDFPVLVISAYSGNVWWGGAYYNYSSEPTQQLSRESPPKGYFYIKLNTDKLLQTEPHYDDPAFWASKIAHEILHNLGYWHPNYKDPAERDAYNRENEWAFIVSYEKSVYDALRIK